MSIADPVKRFHVMLCAAAACGVSLPVSEIGVDWCWRLDKGVGIGAETLAAHPAALR